MRRAAGFVLALVALVGCARLRGETAAPVSGEPPLHEMECHPGPCPSPEAQTATSFSHVLDAELSCPGREARGSYSYSAERPGADDPASGARELYTLEPEDELDLAGPRDGEAITWVRRDGALIGAAHWTRHEGVGWLPGTFAVCPALRSSGGW